MFKNIKVYSLLFIALGITVTFQNCSPSKVAFDDVPVSRDTSSTEPPVTEPPTVVEEVPPPVPVVQNKCSDRTGGLYKDPFNLDKTSYINPDNGLDTIAYIRQCKSETARVGYGMARASFAEDSLVYKGVSLGDFFFGDYRNSVFVTSRNPPSYEKACLSGLSAGVISGNNAQTAVIGLNGAKMKAKEITGNSIWHYLENVETDYLKNFGTAILVNTHVKKLWGNHVILINSTVDEITSGCAVVYMDASSRVLSSPRAERVLPDKSSSMGYFENGVFKSL